MIIHNQNGFWFGIASNLVSGNNPYTQTATSTAQTGYFTISTGTVNTNGISKDNLQYAILPNPSNGNFEIIGTDKQNMNIVVFDAIGKERGDNHETGEIKRVVSFLLMQLDQLPSYVVTIAATNHAELLDKAVWRRFQIRSEFPAPSASQTNAFLEQILGQWPDRPKLSTATLSKKLRDSSFSEIIDFCQNVRRRQILGLGEVSVDTALKVELELWDSRVKPRVIDADEFGHAAPEAKGRARAKKATR